MFSTCYQKMSDGEHMDNCRYETKMLKDQSCLQCGENFIHRLHCRKKRNFPHKKFSFYLLKTSGSSLYYLHPTCLIPLLKSPVYIGKKIIPCRILAEPVITITLMNRLGEPLYKTNYVNKLEGMLQKVLEKECKEDFLEKIRVLYKVECDFPRYTYTFNSDEETFEKIKKQCNDSYKEKNVFIDPSIKEVTNALYKGFL